MKRRPADQAGRLSPEGPVRTGRGTCLGGPERFEQREAPNDRLAPEPMLASRSRAAGLSHSAAALSTASRTVQAQNPQSGRLAESSCKFGVRVSQMRCLRGIFASAACRGASRAAPSRMSCSETSISIEAEQPHRLHQDDRPGDDRGRAIGMQARHLAPLVERQGGELDEDPLAAPRRLRRWPSTRSRS